MRVLGFITSGQFGVPGRIGWGIEHRPAGHEYDLDATGFRMLRRMPDLLCYGNGFFCLSP